MLSNYNGLKFEINCRLITFKPLNIWKIKLIQVSQEVKKESIGKIVKSFEIMTIKYSVLKFVGCNLRKS